MGCGWMGRPLNLGGTFVMLRKLRAMAIAASIALVVATGPTGSLSLMLRASAMVHAGIGANVARGLATHSAVTKAIHRPTLAHPAASANPITEFPIPNSSKSFGEITSGPDGNLWFTGRGDYISGGIGVSNKIGRITPAGGINPFST